MESKIKTLDNAWERRIAVKSVGGKFHIYGQPRDADPNKLPHSFSQTTPNNVEQAKIFTTIATSRDRVLHRDDGLTGVPAGIHRWSSRSWLDKIGQVHAGLRTCQHHWDHWEHYLYFRSDGSWQRHLDTSVDSGCQSFKLEHPACSETSGRRPQNQADLDESREELDQIHEQWLHTHQHVLPGRRVESEYLHSGHWRGHRQ